MLSCGPNSWFGVLQINQEWLVATGHFGCIDYAGADIELAFILGLDEAIMTSE